MDPITQAEKNIEQSIRKFIFHVTAKNTDDFKILCGKERGIYLSSDLDDLSIRHKPGLSIIDGGVLVQTTENLTFEQFPDFYINKHTCIINFNSDFRQSFYTKFSTAILSSDPAESMFGSAGIYDFFGNLKSAGGCFFQNAYQSLDSVQLMDASVEDGKLKTPGCYMNREYDILHPRDQYAEMTLFTEGILTETPNVCVSVKDKTTDKIRQFYLPMKGDAIDTVVCKALDKFK